MNTQNKNSSVQDSIIFNTPETYSHKSKQELKEKTQDVFNIKKGKKNMLIGFSLTEDDSKHNYYFEQIMDGLSQLPVNVLVVGKKKSHYQDYKNIKYIAPTEQNKMIVQASVDVFLLPESYNFENECLSYGTTSIYFENNHYSGHLKAYNPLEENGNGIPCQKENHWVVFASVVRALETYKFSYDWKNLCKNAFDTGQGV